MALPRKMSRPHWPHCLPRRPRRHEPGAAAEPGAVAVRAVVPDPRRAVLDLPTTAAQCGPPTVRCLVAGDRAGRVRCGAALGAWLRRSTVWRDVAAGAGDVGRLRRVPRRAGHRDLRATRLVAAPFVARDSTRDPSN